jgi:hypothetical protein
MDSAPWSWLFIDYYTIHLDIHAFLILPSCINISLTCIMLRFLCAFSLFNALRSVMNYTVFSTTRN